MDRRIPREGAEGAGPSGVGDDERTTMRVGGSQLHDTLRTADAPDPRPTVAEGRTVVEVLRTSLPLASPERYRAVELLGRGGMGEVRRTLDTKIGREVALKTMLAVPDSSTQQARARFLREARVQAILEHPAMVPVYDIDVGADGLAYFTMKRIRGETLDRLFEEARRQRQGDAPRHGLRRLLVKFVTVCLAVHCAHEHGVVHRDLKPQNVMLGPHGEVYVLDWGVAKIRRDRREPADPTLPDTATRDGEVIGTPGYMAPEQALALHEEVDERTDVYALGAILHEILTLGPLHAGPDVMTVLSTTIDPLRVPGPPPPDVPPELYELVCRCTRYHKGQRPASAREVAEAIERYLDGDRDEAMRRRLADERAERACTHADEVFNGPPGTREAARARAMQEAGRALALAPEHAGAADTVVRLLAAPPDVIPAEADRELAALEQTHLRSAMRDNALRIASWALVVPIPILMGLRAPWLVAAIVALFGASTFAAVLFWRHEVTGGAARMALYVMTCVFAASVSGVFGPLVLVPGFVAMNTLIFGAQAQARERPALIAVGIAAICLPLGLELGGVLPPSMRFEADTIVLLPRVASFHPAMSLLFLTAVSVLGVLTPTTLTGRLREALRAAERDLVVQKWQLAQLSPAGAGERR